MGLILSTIIWIIIIGFLSLKFRMIITKILKIFFFIPRFIKYLIVGLILVIIEENLNCPPTGCSLIPSTIIIFLVFLILLLIIVKLFRIKNVYVATFIFGLMGWTAEFLLGYHKTVLWSLPLWGIVLMSIWTFLTYSIIVLIPLTILLE